MRVCYVLLAAAAALLASHQVVAISSRAEVSRVAANEEIQSIDAAPNTQAAEDRQSCGRREIAAPSNLGLSSGKRRMPSTTGELPEYRDHVLKAFDEAGQLKSLRPAWTDGISVVADVGERSARASSRVIAPTGAPLQQPKSQKENAATDATTAADGDAPKKGRSWTSKTAHAGTGDSDKAGSKQISNHKASCSRPVGC
ncbi:hypothetical protein PHYSODRAFT_301954 [Phytophthora sojae]|uniref:RxLR effector protein n=1 Tax=Phytophthora sojae (strain P6497) TaxID=1094619 RepID=G4ZNW7_PHYSP|nr:hypothetical protein PHYSODRAFT_301954 [Phytophthora sojae]EGZ15435.1 hypothetical protein PHYSODRAFT_301954 [Phytophthora sojae]|eukprot:XP_009529184.1 hypothetical protein PHYSODRAFT_301954 [Phytophthora sojae]